MPHFEWLVIKYLRLITSFVAILAIGAPWADDESRKKLSKRHNTLSDESEKFLTRR